MKKIINLLRILNSNIKEIFCYFKISKLKDWDYFLSYNIPSYTQWESKNLVDEILSWKFDTKNDSLYKESWALNPEEYEMYSWQICWITCLKMILKSIYKEQEYKLIELAKEAEIFWVYKRNTNSDLKVNLDWLFHKPFMKFIKKFWLTWTSKYFIKKYNLANLIKNNNFIIASVNPIIREENPWINSKSGHLILVTWYKIAKWKILWFFINNPSWYFGKSQEKHFVKIENWGNCFSWFVDVINYSLDN
ncbi:MAG: hypothetical protein ACD_4C00314G0001 [uncultured bacterium (gcode 4)]|uniref:Peptidase C39-like domain-containing protein n=1 Tax=uncultured bacterium (gcode 4) TaxID=1234023 RepID=K2FTU3_9BACT|nr:MAG: hypothetical protein ACD_4C00314G0001 [uncultured bacterium (gcode 4)]